MVRKYDDMSMSYRVSFAADVSISTSDHLSASVMARKLHRSPKSSLRPALAGGRIVAAVLSTGEVHNRGGI